MDNLKSSMTKLAFTSLMLTALIATPAFAGERGNPNSLATESGPFTFGYVTDGDDSEGPFMLDTRTGQLWRYEKVKVAKKKQLSLTPVLYVGRDGEIYLVPSGDGVTDEATEPVPDPEE